MQKSRSASGTHRGTAPLGIRLVAAAFVTLAMLAASCAAKGADDSAGEPEGGGEEAQTTAAPAGDKFGDLDSPCGEGDFTVEADQSGGDPDVLKIGVANDRTSQIRPGLNKEMWDASNAFAAWCNEQGGIGGLPIEIVDIDGKLLEVESAMTIACNSVFMLVGGGQVQDNLQFTGKPDSDFHECGLADIPGFTVSPEKSDSNGQVQPLPHPSAQVGTGWMQNFTEVDPDDAKSFAIVWGVLPSMETIRNQAQAVIEDQGGEVVGVFDYPVTGLADWTPLAQQVINSGATAMTFVGEPTNLGSFVKSLREQGWEGTPVVETNSYDQTFIDSAGPEAAEGTVIRTVYHPFEEADKWPATQQYIDIVTENVPDAKLAVLGMQSFSAWLLFATAANDCGNSNDNTLTRACVLESAADIEDWTGGGLHAASDPGEFGGTPSQCEMLITVKDGKFARLYPELDSDADNGDGFACYPDSLVEVPDNEGLGKIGPNQPL
ncbi:MAG: ABC transporter substrate-binding protein [Microthrixaceae bacterium]